MCRFNFNFFLYILLCNFDIANGINYFNIMLIINVFICQQTIIIFLSDC